MPSHWMTRPIGLFGGGSQVENFRGMATIYPVRVVRRASQPTVRSRADRAPAAFSFQGETLDTAQFLSEMETTGLLVLKEGRLVFERYWLGNDATTQSASWSVGKSFVSALVWHRHRPRRHPVRRGGRLALRADAEGRRLRWCAAEGRAADVVRRAGTGFWLDGNSDINKWIRITADGGSLDRFSPPVAFTSASPGTLSRYNTTDTHVLGMVVRGATGRSLSEYLQENLWEPLGLTRCVLGSSASTGAEVAPEGAKRHPSRLRQAGRPLSKWWRLERADRVRGLGQGFGDARCAACNADARVIGLRFSVVGTRRQRHLRRDRHLQPVYLGRSGHPHCHRADCRLPQVCRRPSR